MRKTLLFILGAALGLPMLSQTEVTLINPGFEVPEDSAKYKCDDTTLTTIEGFGWRVDSCNDVGREDITHLISNTAGIGAYEGERATFSHNLAGHLYQVVGVVSSTPTTYNLSCQTIYSWSDADTAYSGVYISLFSGTDTTNRVIMAGDSLMYLIADVQADLPSYQIWEEVSVSYTTTAADAGKTLCVEFGNSVNAGAWTYYYHDAFALTSLTGIHEVNFSRFEISPNPSNGIVNIKSKDGRSMTYELYNMLGMRMKSGTLNGTTKLDLRDMNMGVYFINITSGIHNETHKIIIHE